MQIKFAKFVRSWVVVTFAVLLGLSGLVALAGVPNVSAQASPCPQNQILKLALSPIPTSFNLMTAAGDSGYQVNTLEQMGIGPFPLIIKTGNLWWSNVLVDWTKSNSNFTQWTFNIKPGLKWSDGTNITSKDIIDNFGTPGQMYANSSYDFVGLSHELVGAHALNSSAAVLVLNASDSHLPERISQYYYVPLEPPQDVKAGPGANYFGTDVASGPFYILDYTSGSTSLRMLRNPYFNSPTPGACEIDINFVENSAAYVPFLVSGQVDAAGSIPFASMPSLVNYPFLHFNIVKGWFGNSLEFGSVYTYPYNMTAFRQALAYSINYSAIVSQDLLGYGVVTNNAQGGIPSSFADYNPNQKTYSYDQQQALSLLQSIGIKKGSDNLLHYPNGTAISLNVWTDVNKAWDLDVAHTVVNGFQSLGLTIHLQTTSTSNMIGDMGSGAFGIRNAMIIYTSGGPMYPDPWLMAQTGCSIYGTPGCNPMEPNWEPAPAVKDYQGNLTALDNTDNLALEKTFFNNIQAINSQYLPQILLSAPDQIWAYNTQRWTNWPVAPDFLGYSSNVNTTAFAALVPAGQTTTTSTGLSTTSTSTGPSTGYNVAEIAVPVVIAVLIIAVGAVYALRRGKATKPSSAAGDSH